MNNPALQVTLPLSMFKQILSLLSTMPLGEARRSGVDQTYRALATQVEMAAAAEAQKANAAELPKAEIPDRSVE